MAENHKLKVDDLDFQILALLNEDGRKSFTDIAKELGVTDGTIRNRYAKLTENKALFIFGRVDPNRLGFTAYVKIDVAVQPANKIQAVAEEISKIPETSFVAMTSGESDLEVNVMCRDMDHFNTLLREKVHKIEGVSKTKTILYQHIYKIAQPNLDIVRKQHLNTED